MQQKNQKNRKFLIMLPVFLAPIAFIAYLFFGSPKKDNKLSGASDKSSAFNAKLPSANVQETGMNKLELYMQAKKDSAKKRKAQLEDPYEKNWYDPAPPVEVQQERLEKTKLAALSKIIDPNEKKVNDRLEKLLQEINRSPVSEKPFSDIPNNIPSAQANIKQLEEAMATLRNPDTFEDPELARAESILDKALDLQYPERVKNRLAQKQEVKTPNPINITTVPAPDTETSNRFFGLADEQSITALQDQTTILAEVHQDQTVQDGSTIKFRLLQDIFIKENFIPKGNFISGKCALSEDRVNVQLTDITYKNRIFPVALTLYDLDGLLGISVSGLNGADVAKNRLNQGIQNMDLYSYNSSLAAQATSTGVQTLKTLLSNKIRKVQATIKAGHKVLLKVSEHNN